MLNSVIHTVASLNSRSGGPARTVTALCEGLGSLGVCVNIFTQKDKSNDVCILAKPELVRTEFVPAISIPQLRMIYAPSFYLRLMNCCREQKINLIHDNGIWLLSNHSAAMVARRLIIPLIIQPHGMLEPWAFQFKAWKKQLAWNLYQRRDLESASILCATAEQEAENFRKIGLRQPIAIIPNGVEMPELLHKIEKGSTLTKTALFLGRIHPVKGLLELVKAWQQIRPKDWQVIIAGPDENGYQKVVESEIQKAGLQDVFEFVGSVEGERKNKLYQETDLFILPSFTENFGVVVAEALSYNVPVITTKGTPWEGLITHRCGWWIDIGVEPLATAIREAVAISDEERYAMGKRGRLFVEQNFGWSMIAEKMLSVYRWILGGGTKPECVL